MPGHAAKVWAAWAFLLLMVTGTVWDAAAAHTEPFHVLMLSWGAMDISAVQVLLATLTHRDLQQANDPD